MLFSTLRSLLSAEQRKGLDRLVAEARTRERKAQRSAKRQKAR